MCVAGLNVSTQPCNHRWYALVRPCHPANNLANCPERLRLEGWETRNEICPWCNEKEVCTSTHRLFGSTSSASSCSSSPTSPELGATRTHRSGSGGTLSSLSRHSSSASTESERGQRHREMNERLHLYLTTSPHEVLPSARRNYPTYYTTSPSDESPASDAGSIMSASGAVSKGWKKSVRFSKAMFKG